MNRQTVLDVSSQEVDQVKGSRPFHVVVAEDHEVVSNGVRYLLEQADDLDAVGFAADGYQALEYCERLQPDLLLLDLGLPRLNGLLVLERLQTWTQPPRIVVMSGQITGLDFQRAASLGAQGLVSKEDPLEELLSAVREVCAGRLYRSSAVTELLAPLASDAAGGKENSSHLTPREREILALIADGMSNANVAALLSISVKTAKKHRENIRRKLQVNSAVELARAAARLGLTNY